MRLMNRFGAIHYFPDDSVFYSTILANEEFDLLLHYFEWFGWIQVDFLVITRYWNARKWNYFYGFGCFEGKFRMFVWIWSIFREDLVGFRWLMQKLELKMVWFRNIWRILRVFYITKVKKHVFLENMTHKI